MAARGRAFLILALLSAACARSSKESSAPSRAEAGPASLADQDKEAPADAPAPAAPAAEQAGSTKDAEASGGDPLSRAVTDFDRARRELSELLGRDLEQPVVVAEQARPSSAPAAAAPRSRSAADDKAPARDEAPKAKPQKKAEDGCVNICRAFDSLSRSAAAVCRLDDGERCRRANGVVAVARDDAGVRACACTR
jgi:hypothetical protein